MQVLLQLKSVGLNLLHTTVGKAHSACMLSGSPVSNVCSQSPCAGGLMDLIWISGSRSCAYGSAVAPFCDITHIALAHGVSHTGFVCPTDQTMLVHLQIELPELDLASLKTKAFLYLTFDRVPDSLLKVFFHPCWEFLKLFLNKIWTATSNL